MRLAPLPRRAALLAAPRAVAGAVNLAMALGVGAPAYGLSIMLYTFSARQLIATRGHGIRRKWFA